MKGTIQPEYTHMYYIFLQKEEKINADLVYTGLTKEFNYGRVCDIKEAREDATNRGLKLEEIKDEELRKRISLNQLGEYSVFYRK